MIRLWARLNIAITCIHGIQMPLSFRLVGVEKIDFGLANEKIIWMSYGQSQQIMTATFAIDVKNSLPIRFHNESRQKVQATLFKKTAPSTQLIPNDLKQSKKLNPK